MWGLGGSSLLQVSESLPILHTPLCARARNRSLSGLVFAVLHLSGKPRAVVLGEHPLAAGAKPPLLRAPAGSRQFCPGPRAEPGEPSSSCVRGSSSAQRPACGGWEGQQRLCSSASC